MRLKRKSRMFFTVFLWELTSAFLLAEGDRLKQAAKLDRISCQITSSLIYFHLKIRNRSSIRKKKLNSTIVVKRHD